jgi:type II secretory pathway component PulK
MKKFYKLNLDTLIVIAVVFIIAFGFIAYQRSQYLDLLEEHVQLQWQAQDLEINVNYLRIRLAQCKEQEPTSLDGINIEPRNTD